MGPSQNIGYIYKLLFLSYIVSLGTEIASRWYRCELIVIVDGKCRQNVVCTYYMLLSSYI